LLQKYIFLQKYKFLQNLIFFAKVHIFATVDSLQKLLNKKVDWHEWQGSQYTNMSAKAENSETVRGRRRRGRGRRFVVPRPDATLSHLVNIHLQVGQVIFFACVSQVSLASDHWQFYQEVCPAAFSLRSFPLLICTTTPSKRKIKLKSSRFLYGPPYPDQPSLSLSLSRETIGQIGRKSYRTRAPLNPKRALSVRLRERKSRERA
jgi:hypothetical protein